MAKLFDIYRNELESIPKEDDRPSWNKAQPHSSEVFPHRVLSEADTRLLTATTTTLHHCLHEYPHPHQAPDKTVFKRLEDVILDSALKSFADFEYQNTPRPLKPNLEKKHLRYNSIRADKNRQPEFWQESERMWEDIAPYFAEEAEAKQVNGRKLIKDKVPELIRVVQIDWMKRDYERTTGKKPDYDQLESWYDVPHSEAYNSRKGNVRQKDHYHRRKGKR